MLKSIYLKSLLITSVITISVVSCKKKKSTPVTDEPVVVCFNTQNNDSYKGSGTTLVSSFTSGTITITRTSCDIVNYNLNTNTGGQIISQATQLTLNSGGGYDGKQSDGNNITLTFGSVLTINAIGSFSFTGTKQP